MNIVEYMVLLKNARILCNELAYKIIAIIFKAASSTHESIIKRQVKSCDLHRSYQSSAASGRGFESRLGIAFCRRTSSPPKIASVKVDLNVTFATAY